MAGKMCMAPKAGAAKVNMSKAPVAKPALRYGEKAPAKPYKIPAAPKSSGAGWGGEKPTSKKK